MTTVGLVQINWDLRWSDTSGDERSGGMLSLFPYSIGLLRAYAEANLPAGAVSWLEPVFRRTSVAVAVDQLEGADLVGFSVYVWNIELSLAIAAELKRRRPGVVVVFGGPQVPDSAEAFLRAHRFIDVACHGEGEATFAALVDRVVEARGSNLDPKAFAEVAGVSYLVEDVLVTTTRRSRLEDLGEVPSPYLGGVFDGLVEAYPDERWIATWETNRGCPFSCTFCDWGSATASRVQTFTLERLSAEIEWFAAHEIGYLFCCDANFGLLPRDVEIAKLLVASKERSGFPFSVSVQNAKNATERTYEIQHLLASAMHTTGVTLALQSTSRETLVAIRRQNIRPDSYEELQRRYVREGIYTYTDLIIGLPGDSYESFVSSIDQVIASGQHDHIQFHNCSVLPNAEMADPAYRERYGLVTVPQPIRTGLVPADERPEVEEYLDTVVATSTMPASEWVRAKTFAWMTDLVYFDRLFQIPVSVFLARTGASFRTPVEALLSAEAVRSPALGAIRKTFEDHARSIQAGGLEYLTEPGSGDLLWPADLYVLRQLVRDGALEAVYAEARAVLLTLLGQPGTYLRPPEAGRRLDDATLVAEAFGLNRALLCLPHQPNDVEIRLPRDLYAYWTELRRSEDGAGGHPPASYRIRRHDRSWDGIEQWSRFLAASHGFDKRRYLYDVDAQMLVST